MWLSGGMVYAVDSKSTVRKGVRVRVSWEPPFSRDLFPVYFVIFGLASRSALRCARWSSHLSFLVYGKNLGSSPYRGARRFRRESISDRKYSIPPTKRNHSQSVVLKVSKSKRSSGDHLHLRVETFSDPVVLCKSPHPDNRLKPGLKSFSECLKRLPRTFQKFVQMPEKLRDQVFSLHSLLMEKWPKVVDLRFEA